jgi:hypothetical protein
MPEDFKRHVLHHENPFMFLNGDRKTVKYTERKFIPNDPESEEFLIATSEELADYINNNLKITPGQPLFATNLIDCDVLIYLKLPDDILNSRMDS